MSIFRSRASSAAYFLAGVLPVPMRRENMPGCESACSAESAAAGSAPPCSVSVCWAASASACARSRSSTVGLAGRSSPVLEAAALPRLVEPAPDAASSCPLGCCFFSSCRQSSG